MTPGPHRSKAPSSEFRLIYRRSDFNIALLLFLICFGMLEDTSMMCLKACIITSILIMIIISILLIIIICFLKHPKKVHQELWMFRDRRTLLNPPPINTQRDGNHREANADQCGSIIGSFSSDACIQIPTKLWQSCVKLRASAAD